MTEFTRGPWKTAETNKRADNIKPAPPWHNLTAIVDRNGHTLANVVTKGPKGEANARLIAAAPDLLAALEGLLNEVEKAGNANADDYGWPTVVPQARAAIAKARNQ
jgi:hypothetical protein